MAVKKESKSTKRELESIGAKKNPIKATGAKQKTEQKRYVMAKEVAAKEEGSRSKKTLSKGLADKIYRDEEKAGKTVKRKSVKDAMKSKAASKYK